jgi:hypothetical protein
MEFAEIDSGAAGDESLLAVLGAIDFEFPCMGRYFRAGAHRRQVVAAALAPTLKARGDDKKVALARLGAVSPDLEVGQLLAAVGLAISEERGADLIRRAYGDCPHGLIGALERSGGTAHSSRYYRDLFRVFYLPEHRTRAKTLQYEPELSPRLVRTALELPVHFCVSGFLHAAARTNLSSLLAAVDLIKEICSATDEALAASIPKGDDVSINSWVAEWTAKASLPRLPTLADDLLTPLVTVAEMQTLGREMRNCLHSKSISALSGKSSYLRAMIDDAPYVVELVKAGSAWSVGGIYASRNLPVPTEVKKTLTARLEANGILPESSCCGDNDRWEPIRRALRNAPLTEEDFYQPDWME